MRLEFAPGANLHVPKTPMLQHVCHPQSTTGVCKSVTQRYEAPDEIGRTSPHPPTFCLKACEPTAAASEHQNKMSVPFCGHVHYFIFYKSSWVVFSVIVSGVVSVKATINCTRNTNTHGGFCRLLCCHRNRGKGNGSQRKCRLSVGLWTLLHALPEVSMPICPGTTLAHQLLFYFFCKLAWVLFSVSVIRKGSKAFDLLVFNLLVRCYEWLKSFFNDYGKYLEIQLYSP